LPPKVFINYRREDSRHAAGRINDAINHEFGDGYSFLDVSSIEPGQDWPDILKTSLEHAELVLVIIGPSWLTVGKDEQGKNRIDEASDWVRLEIEQALDSRKKVIPVLIDEARIPLASELPKSLKSLADKQKFDVRDGYWEHDLGLLFDKLDPQRIHRPEKASLRQQSYDKDSGLTSEHWSNQTKALSGIALSVVLFILMWFSVLDLAGVETFARKFILSFGDIASEVTLDPDIEIVGIPKTETDSIGENRLKLARLVDQLADAGAAVIALDIFFKTEKGDFAVFPEEGEILAQSLIRASQSSHIILTSNKNGEIPDALKEIQNILVGHACTDEKQALVHSLPLYFQELENTSSSNTKIKQYAFSAMAVQSFLEKDSFPKASETGFVHPDEVTEGEHKPDCPFALPKSEKGILYLKTTPLEQLLSRRVIYSDDNSFVDNRFEKKLVVLGYEDENDVLETSPEYSRFGYLWHVDAINNLLSNIYAKLPSNWTVFAILLLCTFAGLSLRRIFRRHRNRGRALLLLISLVFVVLSVWFYAKFNLLFNFPYMVLALLVGWVAYGWHHRKFRSRN